MSIFVPGGSGGGSGAPSPTGVTTLADLVASVRRKIGDQPRVATSEASGDGERVFFVLPDARVSDLSATVDGVPVLTVSVNEDTGEVGFSDAPGAGDDNVLFDYVTAMLSDEQIIEALNSGMNTLFGSFYVEGTHDDILTTGAQEYVVTDENHVDLPPGARVTKVEWWNAPHWVRHEGWTVHNTRTQKFLHFSSAPQAGLTLRISYVSWPGILSDNAETLEATAGLPTRAREPITDLACADLMEDRLLVRIRDDRAHNSQNENGVKSYEIQNAANVMRARAMLKARRLRQDSLGGRVHP